MEKISIDTAVEILSYIWAKKIHAQIASSDDKEKELLDAEIMALMDERDILYGDGTKEDFRNVMHKVIHVHAPFVKDAIARRTSIRALSEV